MAVDDHPLPNRKLPNMPTILKVKLYCCKNIIAKNGRSPSALNMHRYGLAIKEFSNNPRITAVTIFVVIPQINVAAALKPE